MRFSTKWPKWKDYIEVVANAFSYLTFLVKQKYSWSIRHISLFCTLWSFGWDAKAGGDLRNEGHLPCFITKESERADDLPTATLLLKADEKWSHKKEWSWYFWGCQLHPVSYYRLIINLTHTCRKYQNVKSFCIINITSTCIYSLTCNFSHLNKLMEFILSLENFCQLRNTNSPPPFYTQIFTRS